MKASVAALVVFAVALVGCGDDEERGAKSKEREAPAEPGQRKAVAREKGSGDFFALRQVASGFDQSLALVPAPDSGELHVVEQGGRVAALEGGRAGRTLIDLSDRVKAGGEQGLLGLAFHPEYERNGRLFVHYTNDDGDTRVDEYRARDGVADPSTRKELLAVDQPYPNHNGGELSFGPDKQLYLGLGDGGSAFDPEDNGQSLDTRLGKLLRLDVDRDGAGWEIAAYGLRNPWRFSWDRETGSLWIGDVGQDEKEEIDAVAELPDGDPPNFGWAAFEGTHDPDRRGLEGPGSHVGPVAEYDHDDEGHCSVTGGYVYRGKEVAALRGRYVYGDLCSGAIWTLKAGRDSASDVRREDETVEQLASFGADARGELYAIALDGRLFRLVESELEEGR